MNSKQQPAFIKAWRPLDVEGLELRRGIAVTSPVPRHWHEEYQFCLIESGAGELRYRGCDLHCPTSSFFMVQPGEVHANWTGAEAGCGYWMMFVDAELMRSAAEEVSGSKSGLPFFPTSVVFDQRLVSKYLSLQFVLARPSSTLERESLLANFLTDLILRFSENRPEQPSDGAERHAVKRACDYVVEHYDENVSLAALARVANLSAFHFNRVFSKHLGMPPHEFQIQVRVSRAKELLRQGWSISQVASQTGFADQSHLTRHFKRLVIVTPGHYKENSKNVQDAIGLY